MVEKDGRIREKRSVLATLPRGKVHLENMFLRRKINIKIHAQVCIMLAGHD